MVLSTQTINESKRNKLLERFLVEYKSWFWTGYNKVLNCHPFQLGSSFDQNILCAARQPICLSFLNKDLYLSQHRIWSIRVVAMMITPLITALSSVETDHVAVRRPQISHPTSPPSLLCFTLLYFVWFCYILFYFAIFCYILFYLVILCYILFFFALFCFT